MALTAAQTKELYQFFNVAFNAAPGVEYMNQLYEARNSGMSMEQVVEVFTTKTQFTSIYPNFLTNETFASRLVDNVVGDSATADAKASAAADIVAALALGWSRGKVIYTIFGNLANKETTDATWGTTATQFNNQVAVAQYYTETLLVNTTDTAKLQAVIANVTATTDVSSATAIETIIYTAGATTDVAGELSTTAGETVTGTPGNDTFAATLGLDLQDGDKILGGSGTDTLNIRAATGFTGITQLESIENINLNVRSTSELNLLLASGVDTVTVGSDSVAGQTMTVTNADAGVDFVVNASGTNLTVGLEDSAGTGDVMNIDVNVAAATLTVNGTVETTNLEVTTAGTGAVTLNAGAGAKVNLTGSVGAGGLDLSLTASALNAESFSGAVDLTGTLATSFTFSGGAANDTVTIDLSASDRLFGGAGTDSLVVSNTSGIAITNSNVVGFESVTVSPSGQNGGTVTVSNSGLTSITVNGTSGSPDLNLVLEMGGTITLKNTSADDYNIGATGGSTLTINQNSGVALDDFTVSGASTANINWNAAVGASTVDTIAFENGVATVDVARTGSGALTVSNVLVSGVTDLGITTGTQSGSNGNVTISNISMKSYTNTLNTDLTALSITGNGSGNTLTVGGTIYGGSGLSTVTLGANGDMTLLVNEIDIDEQGANVTMTVNQTGSGEVGAAGAGLGMNMTASGAVTLDVNMNGPDGDMFFSAMSVAPDASGTLVATIDVSASGDFIMATADSRTTSVTLNVGVEGSATIAEVNGSATVALTATEGGSGSITIASVSAGQLTGLTLNAGVAGAVTVSEVTLVSGAGDISLTAASGGLITLSSLIAQNKEIGDITVAGSGDVLFGGIAATGMGHLTIGADARVSAGTSHISAITLGDLNLNGDGSTFEFATATSVGDVVIGGSGVTLEFNSAAGAVSLESLTITGSGQTTVSVNSAAAVGEVLVDIAAASTATLNFASVTSAIEVTVDTGNVQIYAPSAAAIIVDMTAGVGSGNIYLTGTGHNDSVTLIDFTMGTDKITLTQAGINLGMASAILTGNQTQELDVVVISGASAALSVGSSVVGTAATDVIVLTTGTYANVSAALEYLGSAYDWSGVVGGSAASTLGSALEGVTAGAGFLLAYDDTDGNSYLYHVTMSAAGAATFTATTNNDIDLIATFEGLDLTAGSGSFFGG